VILNPIQIPANPPTAVRIIDEKENKSAPHKSGTYPPIVEPMNILIQIIDFELIIFLSDSLP
jgi:hypothetical protein